MHEFNRNKQFDNLIQSTWNWQYGALNHSIGSMLALHPYPLHQIPPKGNGREHFDPQPCSSPFHFNFIALLQRYFLYNHVSWLCRTCSPIYFQSYPVRKNEEKLNRTRINILHEKLTEKNESTVGRGITFRQEIIQSLKRFLNLNLNNCKLSNFERNIVQISFKYQTWNC